MDEQTQMQFPNGRIRIVAAFFLATAFILSAVWIGLGPGAPPNPIHAESDRVGLPTSSMWRHPQQSANKNATAGAVIPQGDVYLAAHITFRTIARAVLGGNETIAITAESEK